jgi:hypothetical protein
MTVAHAAVMTFRRLSLILGLLASAPSPASACGGLFCNAGAAPNPFTLPVAQTAENVLFTMEPGPDGQQKLEAHVQIFYQGPAPTFSWVVPVDGDPQLDVGSDQVFSLLGNVTAASHSVSWQVDGTCKNTTQTPGPSAPGTFATGTGGSTGSADAGATGVTVSFRGDVGPYDAAVLSADDPKALRTWLADNKYTVSPEAGKLIDDYVAEKKHFVAIRLQSGRDVGEIQPLVMRFLGPGPCVPLRLTSVAALQDLRINLYVLAATRVVPTNYYEITVDPARIDWLGYGSNYQDLLKQAANEAGGNAFVTEFSGPPPIGSNLIALPSANVANLAAATSPPDAVQRIIAQGIASDGALIPILRQFIPEPASLAAAGVSEPNFYASIQLYWSQIPQQFAPFNAPALAAMIDKRIIAPRAHAGALFDRFPQLTRLVTFISPEEMTVDPLFAANTTLPPVDNRHVAEGHIACGHQDYEYCSAPVTLRLPEGQTLVFPRGACGAADVNRSALDALPALERGWKRDTQGDGLLRFDNRAVITTALSRSNADVNLVIKAASTHLSGCSLGGGGWDLALVLGAAGVLAVTRRHRSRS